MNKANLPRRMADIGRALTVTALSALAPDMARADMLSGGLLGSVLRGEDFTGPRLIDLAAIGLLIFVLLRLLAGRSKGPDQEQGQPRQPPQPDPYDDNAPPPLDVPPGKPNMYTNAQAAWASLKSPPAQTPKTASAPAGPGAPAADASSEEQFLAGAKMAYGRILSALSARDFADLANFTTPAYLAQLKNNMSPFPPVAPDILLVEATLAGEREENGRTIMEVDYKALVHEPEAPHNTDRRERWRFSRDNAAPDASWLLEGMERRG
jgi:predicted lipid-binding transport protein (Tim44 family)